MNRRRPPGRGRSLASQASVVDRAGQGGTDNGDHLERLIAIAAEDHRAKRKQCTSLTMAKQDLAEPDHDGDRQHHQEEDGQDPSLMIIAAASPAVQRADDQYRCDDQVERQMQPQGCRTVGPAVDQIVDGPTQVGTGPPGDRHGSRRRQRDQSADRYPAVGEVGDRLRRQQAKRYEQEQVERTARPAGPDRRRQCGDRQPDDPERATDRLTRLGLVNQGRPDRPHGPEQTQWQRHRRQLDQARQQAQLRVHRRREEYTAPPTPASHVN